MAEAKSTLIEQKRLREFCALVLRHYRRAGRHALPWRHTRDPYHILISEVMLQQTQVSRVMPKYHTFIRRFPNFRALASAPLRDMLAVWSGLGYNRRALYLKRIAETVMKDYSGKLPHDPMVLQRLPGIGANTAGSITAFAFNAPATFIETNIRRAFIHHFFTDRHSHFLKKVRMSEGTRTAHTGRKVADADVLPLVKRSCVGQEPRIWYAALMDYGAYLGEVLPKAVNPNRQSTYYAQQTKFEGSERQVRGKILKLLLAHHRTTTARIRSAIRDERVMRILRELTKEGMLTRRDGQYRIAGS